MKKILLSLILVLNLSTNAWCSDYYFTGVDCFKKGLYEKASANLEYAIKINPQNVNARYYLAQSYLMQKRLDDAKTQYNRIIILSPTSDAAILSEKGLSLIQQSFSKTDSIASIDELAKYKDNYLDYVLSDSGDIKKWASFPLTVYIEPKKQKSAVQKAFEQWQTKSNNLVSFNFIDSPQKAKITVAFKDKLESTSTKESYIAGYSTPSYEGIHLSKSAIQLLTIDPESKQELADNCIFATTLHEIGHSLGFVGHSPNENDVMFASSATPKMELTTRDINTLNVFYRIDNKTFLARSTGQTDLKFQQALDYVKNTPEKSIGWSNLGGIYFDKKMYTEAIKSYNKAISIEPDNTNLYNSIGISYRLSGDKQNAYLSFKKACDLDKSNTLYLYQLAVTCLEIGKKDVGKSYLDAYLKAHPEGASDTRVKSILQSYR